MMDEPINSPINVLEFFIVAWEYPESQPIMDALTSDFVECCVGGAD